MRSVRQAFQRWWEWETRAFRWGRAGPTPGQLGLLVGIAIVLVGVVFSAWAATAR